MMKRRSLAIWTALCMFVGVLAFPAAPALVCRLTGQTTLVTAVADAPDPCCTAAPVLGADGQRVGYALTTADCCALTQEPEREAPAVVAAAPLALALPVTTPPLFVPPALVKLALAPQAHPAALRAPPLLGFASRAPPFLP
jgi:hypothetical protein